MNGWLIFILGFLLGMAVFWCYSFVTDKLNLLKLGYTGGSWLIRFLYNRIKAKTNGKRNVSLQGKGRRM